MSPFKLISTGGYLKNGFLRNLKKYSSSSRFLKLPLITPVNFALKDGVCETLEGLVEYQAGDAILTGVTGERWPIQITKFIKNYEPLETSCLGKDGLYRKKPILVWAMRLKYPLQIAVGSHKNIINGNCGDWLVQYAPGDFGVVSKLIFEMTYKKFIPIRNYKKTKND